MTQGDPVESSSQLISSKDQFQLFLLLNETTFMFSCETINLPSAEWRHDIFHNISGLLFNIMCKIRVNPYLLPKSPPLSCPVHHHLLRSASKQLTGFHWQIVPMSRHCCE